MNYKNGFSLFILLFAAQMVCAQIFVKADAVGNNDGSSWDNAYTDLSDALSSAVMGSEIWVAAGEYRPGGAMPSRDTFFTFGVDLEIYGGFQGDETTKDTRDPDLHWTILTGDHAGDDTPGDFDQNKTDNSKHVMWLEVGITGSTILDGLIISGGHTDPSTASGNDRRGGGILTYGAPTIRNCLFTNNFGHFGGGLYPRGAGADGIVIQDCRFLQNRGGFGGGIYINSTTGSISSCSFEDNGSNNSGAALYTGCEMGCDIDDCQFLNNDSDARGGAIYNSSSPSTFMNSIFENNKASSSTGGSMHITTFDGDPASVVSIANCEFRGGEATWGGALSTYNERTMVTVSNSIIEENTAGNNGGGCHNGFGAQVEYSNCRITKNEANRGGAFNSQNDSVIINLIQCELIENASATNGGAMTIVSDDDPLAVLPSVTLDRVIMEGNICGAQGAGADFGDANVNVINSLLSSNFNTGDGAGGAISFNASDSFSINLNMMNSTVVGNFAQIGAGVSLWEGPLGEATMTTQNTIFHNPDGLNYEIEDGIPEVLSNGGNLSSDDSFFELTGQNDLVETDPGFVDESNADFHLTDGSAAVNSGIANQAPDMDLEGNPRVGNVDMGAYENQNVTSVWTPKPSFGALTISLTDENSIIYEFTSDYRGKLTVAVLDMHGKLMFHKEMNKSDDSLRDEILADLADGVYTLSITNGKNMDSRAFVWK